MTSIDIADGTQVFVVATDKRRTAADLAAKLQNGSIDFMAKLDHCFGLIEVLAGKKRGPEISEGSLGCNQNLARVFSPSG